MSNPTQAKLEPHPRPSLKQNGDGTTTTIRVIRWPCVARKLKTIVRPSLFQWCHSCVTDTHDEMTSRDDASLVWVVPLISTWKAKLIDAVSPLVSPVSHRVTSLTLKFCISLLSYTTSGRGLRAASQTGTEADALWTHAQWARQAARHAALADRLGGRQSCVLRRQSVAHVTWTSRWRHGCWC